MRFIRLTRQWLSQLGHHLPRRLFQRDPMPDGKLTGSQTMSDAMAARCLRLARLDEAALYQEFSSHPEGLLPAEAEQARARHGDNRIPGEQAEPWWRHLWRCYRNPFNLLLTLLGLISYATEDLTAALVIALMVLISTLLNFIQEARSGKAADALKAMVSNKVTVLRSDVQTGYSDYQDIPLDLLVPGDIVKLAAGDMIPADLRILQARDLFISQASLTGESLPVEKVANSRQSEQMTALECDTLCFMGTNVVSGTALAMVIATGGNTWFANWPVA